MRQDDDDLQDLDLDDDELDQDQDDRAIRIGPLRISRDMLVLLGALAFLILAVILTFLFPVEDEEQIAQQVAETVVAETALAETAGIKTAIAITATTQMTTTGTPGIVGPGTPSPTGTGEDAYPSPDGPEEEATGYPAPGQTPDAEEATPEGDGTTLPTFAPVRTTPTPRPTATPTPDAGYPAPQPTSPPPPTSPPRPTSPPPPTSPPRPTATQDLSEEPDPTQPAPVQPDDPGGPPVTEPTGQPVEGATPVVPGQPVVPGEPGAPVVQVTPLPTAIPVDVLAGEIRWSSAQSPVILSRDVQLAPGSTLIIEPGVEIRLGVGVAIFVDGAQLRALGAPGQPVRFVSDTGARWEAIFGRPNSTIVLEHTELTGGGAGGTLLTSERNSELAIRQSQIYDNGGTILVTDSKLEVRESQIAGNDLPYGAAVDAVYTGGNFVTMIGNRIGGNRQSEGAPVVRLSSSSTLDVLNLDIQSNMIRGNELGSNLLLSTNGSLYGTVACNTLIGGNLGLSIRTQTEQVPGLPRLGVTNNAIDNHTPPIIPIYLEFGIGRGATSEVELDMTNNWWGDPTGPYDPQFNPLGRGDSVGDNIAYEPWLTEPPPCVPPE